MRSLTSAGGHRGRRPPGAQPWGPAVSPSQAPSRPARVAVQLLRRTALTLLTAVAGVVLTLMSAAPATGHATLLGTDSADGEVLTAPPAVVTLTFDDGTVQANDAGLGLIDATGDLLAASTGSTVVESLHQGAQVFVYLGILGASGLVLFRTLLLDREARIVHAPVLRLTSLFAVAALAGLVVYLAADGAWRTGAGPSGLVDLATLWDTLTGTPVGLATVVALVGLVLVLGTGATPVGRVLLCCGAVLTLLSLPLTGHSRSFGPGWLVLGSDAVHVTAGAVWFGGVLGLLITLRSSAPTAAAARTVARFSTAAAWVVLALAVTGTVLAWRILPDLGALTGTAYGLTLLAKVAVVGLVVAIAAWNRFRLVPRVGDDDGARTRLRRTVGTEAWLILLAVAVTGVLVSQSPTGSHEASAPAQLGASTPVEVAR